MDGGVGWGGVGGVEGDKTIMKTLFRVAMTQLQAQISLQGVQDVSLALGEFEAHTSYVFGDPHEVCCLTHDFTGSAKFALIKLMN